MFREFPLELLRQSFREIRDLFNTLNQRITKKHKIEIPINDFISSHIHMMVNRQYTSKQRMYELIISDHLYRYYKTNEHRKL